MLKYFGRVSLEITDFDFRNDRGFAESGEDEKWGFAALKLDIALWLVHFTTYKKVEEFLFFRPVGDKDVAPNTMSSDDVVEQTFV